MSQEAMCSVIFTGELREEISPQQARDRLAQKFKITPEQAAKLFDGKTHYLKKQVPSSIARKLQHGLFEIGLITHIVNSNKKTTNQEITKIKNGLDKTRLSANDVPVLFNGSINKLKVSFWYQLGLIAVSLLVVIMPLLYLSLAIFFFLGTLWYMFNALSFLPHTNLVILVLIYISPIVAGFVVSVFMFKPLLARPAPRSYPLELNPRKERALFEFVYQIADKVGAPRPRTIAVDCEVNASASFYQGMSSFRDNELTLTLGMPLFSAMSLQQLAGIIAHEFGHFSQNLGMRATYIIRSVNYWFYRSVHERDSWDDKLEELAESEHDWLNIIFSIACLAVGISRFFIKQLSWITDFVSHFMLRQMEYDADRYEAQVAGSNQFRNTSYTMRLLIHAFTHVYHDLGVIWEDRKLVDDIPSMVQKKSLEIEPGIKQQIESEMETEQTEVFSTHPGDIDRIKNAEKVNSPGIMKTNLPAKSLFIEYERYAKLTTERWYRSTLGIDLQDGQLISKNEMMDSLKKEGAQNEIMNAYFRQAFLSFHFIQPVAPSDYISVNNQERKALLDEVVSDIRHNLPDIERHYDIFCHTWDALHDTYLEHCFRANKLPEEIVQQFQVAGKDYVTLRQDFDSQQKNISRYENLLAKRMAMALSGVIKSSDENQQQEIKNLLLAQKQLASCQALYDNLNLDGYVLHNLFNIALQEQADPDDRPVIPEHILASREKYLSQSVKNLETALSKVVYPFDRAGGEVSIFSYLQEEASDSTSNKYADTLNQTRKYIDRLPQLYVRIMGRLATLAAAYENQQGIASLKIDLKG